LGTGDLGLLCYKARMLNLAFGTPRKLPKASRLEGRVVVVDIAFAGTVGGGFDQVTKKLIDGLGDRLVGWIDHHDHERHPDYKDDPRFVLCTKAEHGACPEMISPELVERIGPVDTVLCHTDFDGLASAAKWILGGHEPYPGCDADAHAVDTRTGVPSPPAMTMDRALRARPRDQDLYSLIVAALVDGLKNPRLMAPIEAAADEMIPIEKETRRAAQAYRLFTRRGGGSVALIDIRKGYAPLDKTGLLLLGQERAQISIVVDDFNVTLAAPFDSGVNFLEILGLDGGMPTRVSVGRGQLDEVLDKLAVELV
jgi:hypothetical protein